MDWDAAGARRRMKELCMGEDGEMDFAKFSKGFMLVEEGMGEMMTGYKMPFADVVDGEMHAIFKACVAIMGVLNGSRGGMNMSEEDRKAVYEQVKKYYKKWGEKAPKLKSIGQKIRAKTSIQASRTKDIGEGIIEAVITTPAVDRHNETIKPDGVDIKSFKKNPIVLYGHDYDGLPIGKIIKLKKTADEISARIQFAIAEYPFARTVYQLIKGGYLNDVSIGGIVTKWSDDYTTIEGMEMLELSVVPVGSNRDAKVIARSIGKTMKEISHEYQEMVHRQFVDKVKDIPQDEVKQAIKVLEDLVGVLKETASNAASSEGEDDTRSVRRIKLLTLKDSAKAVATQSERVIRTIKVTFPNGKQS